MKRVFLQSSELHVAVKQKEVVQRPLVVPSTFAERGRMLSYFRSLPYLPCCCSCLVLDCQTFFWSLALHNLRI